jgi:hypothetical protein
MLSVADRDNDPVCDGDEVVERLSDALSDSDPDTEAEVDSLTVELVELVLVLCDVPRDDAIKRSTVATETSVDIFMGGRQVEEITCLLCFFDVFILLTGINNNNENALCDA